MKKIIIVDDEYIVVNGIKAMIAKEKIDFQIVAYAYDGIEGLHLIKKYKPDIIITDIRMPGMDGLSLIEEVIKFNKDIYCIVISGFQEFEYARKALSLGVKSYIDKPITIEKVVDSLNKAKKYFEKLDEERIQENNQMFRKKYVYQYNQFMNSIKESDIDKCKDIFKELMNYLQKFCISFDEYKKESHQFLCSAITTFYENKGFSDKELFLPYYSNISMCNDIEEVNSVIETIMNGLYDKIGALKFPDVHFSIKQALTYIENNYYKDIGLTEIADFVGISSNYLSILFKEQVGMSYIKYITNVRVEHAKHLLSQGEKVAVVSERVGYSNYRYFIDIFKKQTGKTPSEYKGITKK